MLAATLSSDPQIHKLNGPVTERFDCGDPDQNNFLINLAWEHQQAGLSVTYVALIGGMLAGYVTLVMSEIELSRSERPSSVPFARIGALKVAQMAVDTKFQGQGLGKLLLDFAVLRAQHLAAGHVGCRYVILDAKPTKVKFYSSYGFVQSERAQTEKRARAKKARRDPDLESVIMLFDIRMPGELGPGRIVDERHWLSPLSSTVETIGYTIGFTMRWLQESLKRLRRGR